jgi:hypothetical protein
MPKRSNEFQRFVRDLETLLAPRGATVRESVLLEDMDSGELREVDVVVELPGGPRSVRVGIEVCDRARPADSPWVEGIAKKHERLPIDRTVVVSRRGLSKSAKKKAAACKVEVVTFAEALTDDHWSEVVLQPPFVHVRSEVSWVASFVVLVAPRRNTPSWRVRIYETWRLCSKVTIHQSSSSATLIGL